MKRHVLIALATVAVGIHTGEARAQNVTVTPRLGAYLAAGDAGELRSEAERFQVERDAGFALGMTVELGPLRGSADYVTGKRITEDGLDDGEVGDGSLLAVAAGVALRPIPRIVGIQPYGIAGVGLKRSGYSYNEDGLSDLLPASETDFSLQAGLGVDLMLGRVGVVLEATDYISWHDGSAGRHDAFITAGLRVGLF